MAIIRYTMVKMFICFGTRSHGLIRSFTSRVHFEANIISNIFKSYRYRRENPYGIEIRSIGLPHIKFWWVGSFTHFRNKEISALTRRRIFQKFYNPKISKSLKINQLELKPVNSIVIIRIIGVYTGDYKDIDKWLGTVRS